MLKIGDKVIALNNNLYTELVGTITDIITDPELKETDNELPEIIVNFEVPDDILVLNRAVDRFLGYFDIKDVEDFQGFLYSVIMSEDMLEKL